MMRKNSPQHIAKNTAIMYIRMFIMMIISLYTSRVVLNVLGISDYGVYNVVGGVVGMFAIVSSSLSSSIGRFLTFEIGKGNVVRLKEIFSTAIIVQFGMAVLIIILIEIVGVWFLNNKMSIPSERLNAATFALHCSVASFALGLIMTPYNAAIIAHEKFRFFAYLTIFDAFMKLSVIFLLSLSPIDKLKTYAFLLMTISFLMQAIYFFYCRKEFEECHFTLKCNFALLKEVGGFAGWSFWGNTSWILNSQGIDLVINFFFGVTLNAARGIANQVNNIVQGFVSNFMTTLSPQITKLYAEDDMVYMRKLVLNGAKFSYFLMLFISIPLLLETQQVLVLWLQIIPEYAVPFVRLSLISTLVFVIGNTLTTAQSATGIIRKSAIWTSVFTFLELPLVLLLFYCGFSPVSCYIVHIIIYLGLVFLKVYLVKDLIGLSYSTYLSKVISVALLVTIVAVTIPLIIYKLLSPTLMRMFLVAITSFICSGISIFYLGMKKNERIFLYTFFKKRLS